MAKRKCKYSVLWEDEYTWLKSVKGDFYSAVCTYCQTKFDISKGGKGHVASHNKVR